MAAPNILAATKHYSKTAVLVVTTTATAILTNSVSSGRVLKVNGLWISNVDGTNAADITIDIYRSSTAYHLAKTISVPADATIDFLSRPLVLEEGDTLRLTASADGDLQAVCSYEQISSGTSDFLPSDIAGLQLWLDASDSTTLFDTTSGGSLVVADGGVAQWQDKSGNLRHATQATSGSRPQRKTSIRNSMDVLRFDGTNDSLSISGAASSLKFLHGSAYTTFVVASPRSLSTWQPIFDTGVYGSPSGDSGANGIAMYFETNGAIYHDVRKGASGVIYNVSSPSAVTSSGWYVFGVVGTADSGTAALRSSMRINGGTATANNTQTTTVSTANARLDLVIASIISYNGNGSLEYQQWGGLDIGEILIYNTAMSDINRIAVESHLKSKWGIT
jgi:hypothetical protein